MNFLKRFTIWLLLLTVLTASGIVSAKVASGVQNFTGGAHQEKLTANALMHLAKIDFSYDAVSGFPLATKSLPKLLGSPITWKQKDLARVISKHGSSTSGKGGLLKSRFFEGENIEQLILQGTHMPRVKQASGKNFQRVYDLGRNIGTDVTTGKPTSIMTVVTQPSGRLVTSFPGTP